MDKNVATASRRGGLLLAALAFVLALLVGPALAQEEPPQDTTPPTITLVSPAGDVARPTDVVTATFSEPMDPATVDATTFTLKKGEAAVVAADVTYDGLSDRATFVFAPGEHLVQGATYTAGIGTGARDIAGNPLAVGWTWNFKAG